MNLRDARKKKRLDQFKRERDEGPTRDDASERFSASHARWHQERTAKGPKQNLKHYVRLLPKIEAVPKLAEVFFQMRRTGAHRSRQTSSSE